MDRNYEDIRDDFEKEFDSQYYDEEVIDENEDNNDSLKIDTGNKEVEESDDTSDEASGGRIVNASYIKEITSAEERELKRELAKKKEELVDAREKLNKARSDGDLSENEAYVHFRELVSSLESDINSIENELKTSKIVDNASSNSFIGVGSKVHLIITSQDNICPRQDLTVTIVSEGHGGIIPDTGEIRVPNNSEVYRNMADMQVGEFDLTGTDGNSYHYKFELVRG